MASAHDPPGPPGRSDAADGQPPARSGARLGPGVVVALALAFLVVLGVGAVTRLASAGDGDEDGSPWHGTLLENARERPAFELVDTGGEPYDFAAETRDQLTFLFFGYANCPDVCPITLATLEGALSHLPRGLATVVFVSVDPERDTPQALRAYLDRFDPSFVGLTGTPDQLADAQRAATVSVAQPEEPAEDGSYDVGHSSQVLVMTPDNHVRLIYGFGVRQDQWFDDLERLRAQSDWW